MMTKVFGNVTIPLPEGYADKLKALQRKTAAKGIQKQSSTKSLFSMISRTNMSSTRKSFLTDEDDENHFDSEDDLLLDNQT
mmetsp:Transcript_15116/g.25639  ORF Transcript_15116/g.25639 Transcript_15116/m.25639 type:complete len:81 (-) Transcript_15116:192-434(-)